jgi:glycosyltransferase involved in cell wall biosynthesis
MSPPHATARVAHVLLSLQTGGLERVAVDLANCAGPGFDPCLVCLETSGPMAGELRSPVPPVVVLNRSPGFRPWLAMSLSRQLRKLGISVVHTHNSAAGFYGALAARLAALPVIQTKHGQNLSGGNQRALNRIAYQLTDQVVAVSQPAYELARSEGARADRLRIIDNGVDAPRFSNARSRRHGVRRELGVSPDSIVIGTLGRMVPEKNQRLLIESAGDAAGRSGLPVVLVIVGEGPGRASLAAAAALAPPGVRIVFAGTRRAEDSLPAFDLFVLSSDSEGLPIALLEAMACALPVVVTAVGAMPEVVDHGRAGLLVPPRNRAALTEAIGSLISDPVRRAATGTAGLSRVEERYSARRMTRDYERLYTHVLARGAVAADRLGR